MAAVKSKDTTPELIVRCLVHNLCYRPRLHLKSLPGTPDLVFPRLKKIINVHGCFWHMHSCQKRRKNPVNNAAYWKHKRESNARRDRRTAVKLRNMGWRVLTIWECQTRSPDKLARQLAGFLEIDANVIE